MLSTIHFSNVLKSNGSICFCQLCDFFKKDSKQTAENCKQILRIWKAIHSHIQLFCQNSPFHKYVDRYSFHRLDSNSFQQAVYLRFWLLGLVMKLKLRTLRLTFVNFAFNLTKYDSFRTPLPCSIFSFSKIASINMYGFVATTRCCNVCQGANLKILPKSWNFFTYAYVKK